jgi:acetylglutamate kinase
MVAKINAAMRAVQGAVTSVVIANGINPYTIEQVSTHTKLAYIAHACDLCC